MKVDFEKKSQMIIWKVLNRQNDFKIGASKLRRKEKMIVGNKELSRVIQGWGRFKLTLGAQVVLAGSARFQLAGWSQADTLAIHQHSSDSTLELADDNFRKDLWASKTVQLMKRYARSLFSKLFLASAFHHQKKNQKISSCSVVWAASEPKEWHMLKKVWICLICALIFNLIFGSEMGNMSEIIFFALLIGIAAAGDINRQAIVFYPETPDVFYCPQEKPISLVISSTLKWNTW